MAILRYIISGLLSLALVSCFEEFDPKIDIKPVLCVNSLIKAGEPIEVDVTRSFLYTDENGEHWVTDAEVSIFANGQAVSSDYLPREGDLIRIEVESAQYGRAEAEVRVPFAVPIKSVNYTPVVKDISFSDDDEYIGFVHFDLDIAVTFEDAPGVENYYKFNYREIAPDADVEEVYDENGNLVWAELPALWFYIGSCDSQREPIFGEHIGALDAVMGGDSFGFTFFTDRQISGKSYTLHLAFSSGEFGVHAHHWQDKFTDCGVEIYLSSISKSYYDWANYRWQSGNGVIGGLGEAGLAEQLWGYSNVSTGAGVVAAMSTSVHYINLSEFLNDVIFHPAISSFATAPQAGNSQYR